MVKFLGEDSEININTRNAEFIEWKWVDMNTLPNLIVLFKKHVYEKVLVELKKVVN